jgi:4-hydroxy 2-oxovalerate aldolase
VIAYALAAATSGHAERILLAGFDGYPAGEPRNDEMEIVFQTLASHGRADSYLSITPTRYKNLKSRSVYGL